MLRTLVAEIIEDDGRAFGNLFAYGALAVEYAHRVFVKTLEAGGAELTPVALKILFESGVIILPAPGAAYRIDMKLQVAYLKILEYLISNAYDLRVGLGGGGAEHLDSELLEFPPAPCLRLLIAVAVEQVAELLRHRLVERPCSRKALTAPAVPSGLRVIDLPPLSSKVYISF